ncbi:TetR/AcrR family transcriptional regulator [Arthrobacter sp. E3]|uniref:TetR/AcrR family transcriptional regulator n=1 Tax=Arthrobacter sp. E3 TaxID=517402 RepID=UPI001A9542CF|nr:TetR/AcrR family transcriptional regulator [Arthrobacter sp. E3]
MSISTAKRGRPGHDQASVLRTAVDSFNKHGYEATSMGVLADALGISKSAIYHHVTSKEELLRRALEEALGGLEGVLMLDGATSGAPDSRLEFVLRGTIAVLVDRLPFVTLLLRLRGNTEMEREALARRRAFDRTITGLVSEAQASGMLRDDIAAATITRLLFGTVNSIVEWYKPGGDLSAEKLADDVLAMCFEGLHR